MITPTKMYANRDEWARQIGASRNFNQVVEVGVWRGDYSQTLIHALSPQEFYGVDPYLLYPDYTDKPGHEFYSQEMLDSLAAQVESRLKATGDALIRDFSTKACSQFDDSSLDLVYLDGDHKYSAVSADIQAWWPKVRPGGILAGHDYIARSHVEEFGVIPAVQEFLLREGIGEFHITGEEYATWWVTK
jgi:hypothetical protein